MKYVYVGCRTTKTRNARGRGISLYQVQDNKTWKLVEITPILENPSYLTMDKTKNYLYTVHGDLNAVSAFKIDNEGKLQYINTVSSQGKNPVFITPNRTNKFLFVATLQGGTVTSLPINSDGSLGEAVYVEHLQGLTETSVSHAHQCLLDKSERFLFVPTQGRNVGFERLWVFEVNDETGRLSPVCFIDARKFSEPRHVAIHSDNTKVYLINEKGNSVTYYDFDDKSRKIEPLQIITSLPETYTGEGQASAILVHPNGKFLYASNRIHDSVVCYRINRQTGFLATIHFTPTLGKTPRFMTFNEDGNKLLVANEDSDTIRIFDVNSKTGELVYTGHSIATGSPTCIVFK
ncbi:6-phosphogluconolactonase, cycloisomerase 2 family [Acetomicrobium flavidum]|uniref:6-phosphogluconolactonase, cycloisomerase 2 family n=1 Tax=Acetomicrobium flavidum TaxID=49896 RepID=A0ABY1JDT8_9BACT|nr:6-phosphogluconolactonase, cycloisomerase 2 family [Acetomicrobium flavidum]